MAALTLIHQKPDSKKRTIASETLFSESFNHEYKLFNNNNISRQVVIYEGGYRAIINIGANEHVECAQQQRINSTTEEEKFDLKTDKLIILNDNRYIKIICSIGELFDETIKDAISQDLRESYQKWKEQQDKQIDSTILQVQYTIRSNDVDYNYINSNQMSRLEAKQQELQMANDLINSEKYFDDELKKLSKKLGNFYDEGRFLVKSDREFNLLKNFKTAHTIKFLRAGGHVTSGIFKTTYGPDGKDNSSPKDQYIEPTVKDKVLVCGISENESEAFSQKLFQGDINNEVVVHDIKGNVGCRVNSAKGSFHKNEGEFSIYYYSLDLKSLKEALSQAIQKNLELIENEKQARIDYIKKEFSQNLNGVRESLANLAKANQRLFNNRPIEFCEEKKDGEIFKSTSQFILKLSQGMFCSSPSKLSNGNFVAICDDSGSSAETGSVYIFDASKIISKIKIPYVESNSTTSVFENGFTFSSSDGHIYIFNNNGKLIKNLDTESAHDIMTNTFHYKNHILVLSRNSLGIGVAMNTLYVISLNGEIVTEINLKGNDFTNFVLVEDEVVIASNIGELYFIDSNFVISKRFNLSEFNEQGNRSLLNIAYDNYESLYIGDSEGQIIKHDLKTNRSELFFQIPNTQKTAKRSILHPIVFLKDGTLVIASDLRLFYVLPDAQMKFFVEINGFRKVFGQPTIINIDEEEYIWLGTGGAIEIRRADGTLAMNFTGDFPLPENEQAILGNTGKYYFTQSENFSAPAQINDSTYVVGVVDGLRKISLNFKSKKAKDVAIKKSCNESLTDMIGNLFK